MIFYKLQLVSNTYITLKHYAIFSYLISFIKDITKRKTIIALTKYGVCFVFTLTVQIVIQIVRKEIGSY